MEGLQRDVLGGRADELRAGGALGLYPNRQRPPKTGRATASIAIANIRPSPERPRLAWGQADPVRLNSIGILTGGGLGRVTAHWITTGRPDVDVTGFNIDRLHTYQANPEYRRTRTVESLGLVYLCHYPTRSMQTARGPTTPPRSPPRLWADAPLNSRRRSSRCCCSSRSSRHQWTGCGHARWSPRPGTTPSR